MIRDVTDLQVYQRALKLLRPIYRLAHLIPVSHQKLRRQLVESAESIPPLIAEGFAKKRSEKEFKRFLEMAMGSSDETITHLRELQILSETIPKIKAETCEALISHYKTVSKQIQTMVNRWVTYPPSVVRNQSSEFRRPSSGIG